MKKMELRDWLELVRKCRDFINKFESAVATGADSTQHEGVLKDLELARKQVAVEVMDANVTYCRCESLILDPDKPHCHRLIVTRSHANAGDSHYRCVPGRVEAKLEESVPNPKYAISLKPPITVWCEDCKQQTGLVMDNHRNRSGAACDNSGSPKGWR